MPTKYELIDLVKKMRQAAGLSQADVARKTGITKQLVSKFEAGQRLLSPAKYIKYIDACRVTGSDRAQAVALYNKVRRRESH